MSYQDITKEECNLLTQKIKRLRKTSIYFKERLKYTVLEEVTGIPIGTLGSLVKRDRLTPMRYTILKLYVDQLEERYKEFLELGKRIEVVK